MIDGAITLQAAIGAIVLCLILLGMLCTGVYWVFGVNRDRKELKRDATSDRSDIKDFMQEIRNDIKQIFNRLPAPAPTAGLSPVQLTEFGKEIAKKLDASGWVNNQAASLLNEVKGKEEFEIYQVALQHAQTGLTPDWKRKVAATAYEFGIEEDGVQRVLAVLLRDKFLQLLSPPPHTPTP